MFDGVSGRWGQRASVSILTGRWVCFMEARPTTAARQLSVRLEHRQRHLMPRPLSVWRALRGWQPRRWRALSI